MKKFEQEFNDLLVETFHLILQTELQMIKTSITDNLSMREIHLIEIIGKHQNLTISGAAKIFQITLASVTVMVNKLVDKGYINKIRSDEDGRIVFLSLTNSGKEIDKLHYQFHMKMVNRIAGTLTNFEKKIIADVVGRFNDFFKEELK